MFKSLCTLSLLGFLFNVSFAQSVAIDDTSNFMLPIQAEHLEILNDPTVEYRIEDLNQPESNSLFNVYKGDHPNLGFYVGVVWIRFSLESPFNITNSYIEIQNPNLDEIDFYEKINGQYQKSYAVGDRMTFQNRPSDHRYYQFPVTLEAFKNKEILIRVRNYGDQFYIPIYFTHKETIEDRDYTEQFMFGIYYGLVIFVFLLNLFIYLIIREKANLYYILYIFGLFFLQMGLDGRGFELIWPNSTFWANHALPFFATFSVLFLIGFTRYFLNTMELMPIPDKLFKVIGWILAFNLILSVIPAQFAYRYSILIINAFTFILNLSVIPVAIYALTKKFKPARFFLTAFIILIICVFAFVLRNFGVLESNFFTNYSLQIGSSFEVVLLTFAIVDKFKSFKEQAVERLEEMNQLKSEQNIILEKQVAERTHEIEMQKENLASKNKKIVDSINYAQQIQEAILPPQKTINEQLPESFILFLPRDIVSGDFYWVEQHNGLLYFSVIDCTGHGVPGAMVSVVGHNGLNRCIKEFGLTDPADILNQLRELVEETFEKSEREVLDGMDMALCCYNPANQSIQYAGAHNPLWIIRNESTLQLISNHKTIDMEATNRNNGFFLFEIRGNKQPVGKFWEPKPFDSYTIPIHQGDQLYMFSDGYPDQFGGRNVEERKNGGNKFQLKQLKKLILSVADKTMDEQKTALEKNLFAWMGDLEQIDDICFMGVRMNP